jgi:uncharacterized protein
MNQPDYDAARSYALNRLRNELPATLLYHDFRHTAEDVLPAAERLAALNAVDGEDLQLLKVAAAYHDVGYIEAYWQHELASLRVAAQTLPDFGLAPAQINRVLGMIVATRLPQSPRDLLEQIMADADLDSLGREDYFEMSERLRQELELRGQPRPLHQWQEAQIAFLKGHTYFTEAARQSRQATKDQIIASLEIKLRANGSESSPL